MSVGSIVYMYIYLLCWRVCLSLLEMKRLFTPLCFQVNKRAHTHPYIHTYLHTYIPTYTPTHLHTRTHAQALRLSGAGGGARAWRQPNYTHFI